jgi:hypothetical protein
VSSNTPAYNYSLVQNVNLGGTNLNGLDPANDPLFVNPLSPASAPTGGGNYRLQIGSPLIDKGYTGYYVPYQSPDISNVSTDLDGKPRIYNGLTGLGPYQWEADEQAVVKTAGTLVNVPVSINVLKDEDVCTSVPVFDTIQTTGLHHGALVINAQDSAFVYYPKQDFYGIDSVDYYVACQGTAGNRRLYIIVHKPLSMQYYACPGVSVKLGFEKIPAGATYSWYPSLLGEIPVTGGNDTDTVRIVKQASPEVEQWFVEASYESGTGETVIFPREIVTLSSAVNCGTVNPTGCPATGAVLFREDFGGNGTKDTRTGANSLSFGITEYDFTANSSDHYSQLNSYRLLKYNTNPFAGHSSSSDQSWHVKFSDHTFAGDTTRGYMFMVETTAEQKILFEHTVSDLCADTLYFSAWIANLAVPGSTDPSGNPDLLFELHDDGGNILASYQTGSIARDVNGSVTWRNYGFNFDLPSNITRVKLVIYSRSQQNSVLAMDDIEIRFCAPPVTVESPASGQAAVCEGQPVSFRGSYADAGLFTSATVDTLAFRWEFNQTGNLNDPPAWTPVSSIVTVKTTALTSTDTEFTIPVTNKEQHEGYYRLAVADSAGLYRYNCRLMSDPIELRVVRAAVPPDLRINVLPAPGLTVNLGSYLDTVDYNYNVTWTAYGSAPAFIPGTETNVGAIDFSSLTGKSVYMYKYTVSQEQCGEQSAKVYLHVMKVAPRSKVATIYFCKEHPFSSHIQLNQMLGVEASGGVWNFETDWDNAFTNNIRHISTGKQTGACIFDARNAWTEAVDSRYYHNGNPNHKKFEFTYTFDTKQIRIILIVTDL